MYRTIPAATKRTLLFFAALGMAFAMWIAPSNADTAGPDSITAYPYPTIASPSKVPVTVDGCSAFRLGHHLHVGFSFRNLELHPMTAVKISIDLYDQFHAYLTTLDSTINGTYSPGAEIVVEPIDTPGNRMPVFATFDEWPDAASAVCYVSGALYENGDVWKASERPSLDVASHQLGELTKNAHAAAHQAVANDLAQQKALGYRAASIAPSPLVVPDGWKTASTGVYLDMRNAAALHLLTYVSLTGAGGGGPLKPTDIPQVRDMEGIEVTEKHAMTICGNRAAEYLTLHGTTTTGPQTVDAVKVRSHGVSYVAAYSRPFGAQANSEAEDALSNQCF